MPTTASPPAASSLLLGQAQRGLLTPVEGCQVLAPRRDRGGVGPAVGQIRQIDQDPAQGGEPCGRWRGQAFVGPEEIALSLLQVALVKRTATEGRAGRGDDVR